MCGLFGEVGPGAGAEPERVERALTAMRHRGPDGQGVWRCPSGTAILGHVPLAITDPDGPGQPIASEDGQVVAVVNGEIYDDAPQRARLEGLGHVFRTRSDSELLVHLYEEHGLEVLQMLRGELAFLLWDARARRLLAARDRFGIKPLCFARSGDRLLLASEAKALFAAGVPARWDAAAFWQAANLHYVPPDRTLFEGVAQLPPGCALTWDAKGLRTFRYWDLDFPIEKRALDPGLALEVRARLEEAVRLRLRSQVPVACYLSGGLDSSAIAALAAQAGKVLPCFTVRFDGGREDEFDSAVEVANRLGAPLEVVELSGEDLLEHLPDAAEKAEGLAANGHLPAKFLLSKAVRNAGFEVVLSGEGADEVYLGYAHLRRDFLGAQATSSLNATNTASAGLMMPHGETLPLGALERRLGFVPTFLAAKAALGFRMRRLMRADFTERHADRDVFDTLLDAFDLEGQLRGRHRVEQSVVLWIRLALANYILRTLGDGTEMAHGVEGRVPFLDHPLFEHARTLPLEAKIAGGVEKHVLREAVRPFLPERVLAREKHPFLAPPIPLFEGRRAGALIQDVLRSSAFRTNPFFDPEKVLAWADGLGRLDPVARTAEEPVLLTVLSTCALAERLRLGVPA